MSRSESFLLPKLMSREGQIDRLLNLIMSLPMDKAWRVRVEEAKSPRSLAQNAYLNGVCYKLLGDAIGYERDEVSEYCLGQFFGWKEKRVPKKPGCPNGIESVPIRTTTTDAEGRRSVLSKLEFAEYVSWIQRFAASKGIHIPDPDPDHSDSKEEPEAA